MINLKSFSHIDALLKISGIYCFHSFLHSNPARADENTKFNKLSHL